MTSRRAPEDGDVSRQAPLYGEYATPEEVAALRAEAARESPAPTHRSLSPAPPSAVAVPASTAPESTARRLDRPITIALIAFGVLNLLQYGGALLDFEGFLEVATEGTPAEPIDFTDAARIGGVVLFVVCLTLVTVSGAIAVFLLRRGRLAFWVPLVAGGMSVLAWIIVLVVIVLQTPGALPSPGS
jgi:hypothetical protein